MASNDKTIYVYADWTASAPILMGKLFVNNNRGKDDLTESEAKQLITDIKNTVCSSWKSIASSYGLNRNAIQRMESAFAMEYK